MYENLHPEANHVAHNVSPETAQQLTDAIKLNDLVAVEQVVPQPDVSEVQTLSRFQLDKRLDEIKRDPDVKKALAAYSRGTHKTRRRKRHSTGKHAQGRSHGKHKSFDQLLDELE